MLTLEEMIDAKAGREIKRAVAVKMALQGFQTKDICELLDVSDAFVSKWKIIYQNQGAEGLRLHYHGSEGFLTAAQRDEVIVEWRCRTTCDVAELRDWIESRYGVVYKSKQSYYDLLAEVAMSRRKTQPENTKRDEQQVVAKQADIKNLEVRQPAIQAGQLHVFVQDECHLVWGDASGYVWGRKGERTTVTIQNVRERQTYYGAMDLYKGGFVLLPASAGNGDNTVSFVKHLQKLHEGSQILLIWDNVSYHRCSAMREYLHEVNQGLEEKDWKVTCIAFAPNAPDQNPVEDVWLKGKNYLRQHFYENKTFKQVKECFFNFLDNRIFNFSKMKLYI